MSTADAIRIREILGPGCRDAGRRASLLGLSKINGIDFVEFDPTTGPPFTLEIHFLFGLPPDGFGLPEYPERIRVLGGTRISDINVIGVTTATPIPDGTRVLSITVDTQGDFSSYLLTIGWQPDDQGIWRFALPGVDRFFSVAPVNFRPDCPSDVDCLPTEECPEEELPEPMLDYLAKDYASFRQMLLDLVSQRNPDWIERNPSDIGMALLELFAYEGDQLSYFQDAVANEAYLDTARQRLSAKRHARLVDYRMHDGRNAWTYVHMAVNRPATLPPGQQLLTRIISPLRIDHHPAGDRRPTEPPLVETNTMTDWDVRSDPALARVRVFETSASVRVHPLNNDIRIHTWGNDECCLSPGSTSAHLYAIETPDTAAARAVRPSLQPGDYLLFEEVVNPTTGSAADVDPSHRAIVQITGVHTGNETGNHLTDPLFLQQLGANEQPIETDGSSWGEPHLPLLEVTWRQEDALTFPLCLSTRLVDGTTRRDISRARGNIALADHGRTVIESFPGASTDGLPAQDDRWNEPTAGHPAFHLHLEQGPQTMQSPGDDQATGFRPRDERTVLQRDARSTQPAIKLSAHSSTSGLSDWWPVPDLLDSREFDHHFVADIGGDGRAVLRFGDGHYGRRFIGMDSATVRYRVGNGRDGNIGAEALAHIVIPSPVPTDWPGVTLIRNPLPAAGGVDPESIEEVRQYAPAAFRSRQLRAVTEEDYREAALAISGVGGAVANFRWTGSWHTVFVGIDPEDPAHLITNPLGSTTLEPKFRKSVHDALNRVRLAGYDLEIRSARYVPLEIELFVCARRGYFRGDVAQAVATALAGTESHRFTGLFDPENFTFGQPVYLSQTYAAATAVEGVESVTIRQFHRRRFGPRGEIERGSIDIGPWEIARLDNNPSNPENGTLVISAGGGS